jgi:hypothetical protein
MFIRQKGRCYYVVENHRVNGKVRQKIVAYMGRDATIEDRLCSLSRILSSLKAQCVHQQPGKPTSMEDRSVVEELTSIESKLDKLWALVPRAQRAKVKTYIKERTAQIEQEHQEDLRKLAEIWKGVVP